MPIKVLLTNDAARVLEELYDYIALHDSTRNANYVLEQIDKTFSKLSEFPERGVYPKELLAMVGFVNIARFFSNLTASFAE